MTELRSAVAAAYLAAAVLAFFAGWASAFVERRIWLGAAVMLVFMGTAKQLQLQDDLTATTRELLKAAGWYDRHEEAQSLIAAMVTIAFACAFGLLGSRLGKSDRSVKTAAGALALLLTFVAVRAASFHAMDSWVTQERLGLRLGWWVELAGIAVIAASATAFLIERRRSS